VRRVPDGTLAESLYLHMAARKAPREQFAGRDDRRRYQIWQLQRAVVAAGALGLAACAVYAGAEAVEAARVRSQAAAQLREAQSAAEAYQRITAGFPVTQTSTENLKVAVGEFRRIAQRNAMPEDAFMHVSRVLESFPQFEIESLAWNAGAAGDGREKPPAGAKPEAGAAVMIELSGRVHATQRSDYRGITAQVQRFAAGLGKDGYELVRTQLPFDITSEGTLTGDIGGGRDSNEAPRFTVTVMRRLP
jgi:hypothetical protein